MKTIIKALCCIICTVLFFWFLNQIDTLPDRYFDIWLAFTLWSVAAAVVLCMWTITDIYDKYFNKE